MYSATLEKAVRPICRKFCQDVRSLLTFFFILLLFFFCVSVILEVVFYPAFVSVTFALFILPLSLYLSLTHTASRKYSHSSSLPHTLLHYLTLSGTSSLPHSHSLPHSLHSLWRSLSMMIPSSPYTVSNSIISNLMNRPKTGEKSK